MRHPFLRKVGTKKPKVKRPHRPRIKVCPALNDADDSQTFTPVVALTGAVATSTFVTKNAIQNAPYEKNAVPAKVLPLISCIHNELNRPQHGCLLTNKTEAMKRLVVR